MYGIYGIYLPKTYGCNFCHDHFGSQVGPNISTTTKFERPFDEISAFFVGQVSRPSSWRYQGFVTILVALLLLGIGRTDENDARCCCCCCCCCCRCRCCCCCCCCCCCYSLWCGGGCCVLVIDFYRRIGGMWGLLEGGTWFLFIQESNDARNIFSYLFQNFYHFGDVKRSCLQTMGYVEVSVMVAQEQHSQN